MPPPLPPRRQRHPEFHPKRIKANKMADQLLDVKGMSCPLPIIKTRKALQGLESGKLLEVLATDAGSVADFKAFCDQTGNELVESTAEGGVYRFLIKRLK